MNDKLEKWLENHSVPVPRDSTTNNNDPGYKDNVINFSSSVKILRFAQDDTCRFVVILSEAKDLNHRLKLMTLRLCGAGIGLRQDQSSSSSAL